MNAQDNRQRGRTRLPIDSDECRVCSANNLVAAPDDATVPVTVTSQSQEMDSKPGPTDRPAVLWRVDRRRNQRDEPGLIDEQNPENAG